MQMAMAHHKAAKLPIIDLSSADHSSIALSIRQACVEHGFFYVVNHGIEEELLERVFQGSMNFFSLPLDEKMKLSRKEDNGYLPLFAEKLNPSSNPKGDSKEAFDICTLQKCNIQWLSEELVLPSWRVSMETFCQKALSAGKKLVSMIALALNLEEDYFEKIGALGSPQCFLRLIHYPVSGNLEHSGEKIFCASEHSDYGMITLIRSNGVPGLQICKEKWNEAQIWEDVLDMEGAFVVNIGDMLERWTNCLFRSTLHRVIPTGQERYSVGFFLFPDPNCIVQCLESCRSESCPQRFPPIRSGEYLKERCQEVHGS